MSGPDPRPIPSPDEIARRLRELLPDVNLDGASVVLEVDDEILGVMTIEPEHEAEP